MTQYPSGRAARPRTDSTLDTQARHARYLEALAGLSPHHPHDVRGLLGSVALHLDVAGELLAGDVAPAGVERARAEMGRAKTGLRQVLEALEALLGLTRSSPAGTQRFDLRELIRELQAMLAPAVHDRKFEWSAHLPEPPAYVTGEREALRQALLIAVVEMLLRLMPPGRIELSVTSAGDRVELAIAGVSAAGTPHSGPGDADTPGGSDVLEIVSTTFEPNGGVARAEGAARLVVTLPKSTTAG